MNTYSLILLNLIPSFAVVYGIVALAMYAIRPEDNRKPAARRVIKSRVGQPCGSLSSRTSRASSVS